jgi:hypothetical protein
MILIVHASMILGEPHWWVRCFRCSGQDCAAEDVRGHGEAEDGRRGVDFDADGLDVEGVHHGEVAVRAVPGWWGGADEAGCTGVVGQLQGTLRQT